MADLPSPPPVGGHLPFIVYGLPQREFAWRSMCLKAEQCGGADLHGAEEKLISGNSAGFRARAFDGGFIVCAYEWTMADEAAYADEAFRKMDARLAAEGRPQPGYDTASKVVSFGLAIIILWLIWLLLSA